MIESYILCRYEYYSWAVYQYFLRLSVEEGGFSRDFRLAASQVLQVIVNWYCRYDQQPRTVVYCMVMVYRQFPCQCMVTVLQYETMQWYNNLMHWAMSWKSLDNSGAIFLHIKLRILIWGPYTTEQRYFIISFLYPPSPPPPANCVCGGVGMLFSRCPSGRLSVRDLLVFP